MDRYLVRYLLQTTSLLKDQIQSIYMDPDQYYNRYTIQQKGKGRQIEEPLEPLKKIQSALRTELEQFPLHPFCTAKKGSSTRENAALHLHAASIFRLDIQGCYQAVTDQKILSSLGSDSYTADMVRLCTCTYQGQRILPTGSPTSPILCNIALTPLDHKLFQLASREEFRYSRYLDDMIFSSTVPGQNRELEAGARKILKDYGYTANWKKTRWFRDTRGQMLVTGVSVKQHVAVDRKLKRQIRSRLYNLARRRKKIDKQTRGYLAYIKSIDSVAYDKLTSYYQEKKCQFSTNQF